MIKILWSQYSLLKLTHNKHPIDNIRIFRDMGSSTTHGHDTYIVCRALPSLSSLSDEDLKHAINDSIEIYLHDLEAFDRALPAHFHRKSKAAWFDLTCATVHLCNLISNFCLCKRQAAAMIQHINLLYRVDDFMETLVDAYGISEISVAFEALQRCFQPYLGSPTRGITRSRPGLRRIDSPVESLPSIAKPIAFECDLQDVIARMHTYPISEANSQDRHWYSLELYDFMVAQLEQLDSELPRTLTPGQLHKWITNVGARSVGTNYMFAMFTCLVSADSIIKESLWKTPSSLYLAQEFAQQISVEFRILNDVGGRVRDRRDGTMSSCTLVQDGEVAELLNIAEVAAERSAVLLEELVRGAEDGRRMRNLLGMFRGSVKMSGELYMADEPNRGPS